MRRIAILFLILILVFQILGVTADIGDRERRTIEGTYIFNLTLEDFDKINNQVKKYTDGQEVSYDIMDYTFSLVIEEKDGKYLVLENGEEISGGAFASTSDSLFNFYFQHTIDVPGPQLSYDLHAEVWFDESSQSFDKLEAKRATLELVQSSGRITIGWGELTLRKIESQKESPSPRPSQEIAEGEEGGLDGLITLVKGKVSVITPDGKTLRASRNMHLIPGATIKTDAGGECEIVLTNNQVIRMRQKSIYTLPYLKVKEEKTFLEKGSAFFSKLKDSITGNDYYVETPNTVIGIRGTEFYLEVDDSGNTLILLKEGLVMVLDKDGNDDYLSAGMKAEVKKDGPIVSGYYSAEEGEIFNYEWNFEEEDVNDIEDPEPKPILYIYFILAVIVIIIIAVGMKKAKKKSNHPRYRR